MDRPKVAERNDPSRHITAPEFKDKENRVELSRQGKYTKEARAKRRVSIDPNMAPLARGFDNSRHAFKAAHEIDKMIAANIVAEAKENKKDE